MNDSEPTPYIKDFAGWAKYQQILEVRENAPYANVGGIWWASIGINIGHEQDGKNNLFERPVIIIHKFSAGVYLVMPLTTKPKSGPTIIVFDSQKGKQMYGLLGHIRSIDHRRLLRKMDDSVPPNTRRRLRMEIIVAIAPKKQMKMASKRPPVKQVASETG